jgi:hypothetical protein
MTHSYMYAYICILRYTSLCNNHISALCIIHSIYINKYLYTWYAGTHTGKEIALEQKGIFAAFQFGSKEFTVHLPVNVYIGVFINIWMNTNLCA